ncbi:hypothetical protein [Microbacterium sp.]|uniref:hypothetical protein n=1 Tax=Microbacterium sp. TaxID=51671 RepID=UPI002810EEE4|nr:hypothetical protein [Microbacterium sp.]
MNADPDDDALSWDGDEGARRASPPEGWKAVGRGSEHVGDIDRDSPGAASEGAADAGAASPPTHSEERARPADETASSPDERSGLSSAALLALGVLGGVYLLYTVGWIVGGLRLKALAPLIVSEAMYVPWFVLAVGAPALWFLTTWVCTRRSATWVRMALLAAGAVLLVPWPFVTMGALGA